MLNYTICFIFSYETRIVTKSHTLAALATPSTNNNLSIPSLQFLELPITFSHYKTTISPQKPAKVQAYRSIIKMQYILYGTQKRHWQSFKATCPTILIVPFLDHLPCFYIICLYSDGFFPYFLGDPPIEPSWAVSAKSQKPQSPTVRRSTL